MGEHRTATQHGCQLALLATERLPACPDRTFARCYAGKMLTRAQVARRLGKSIATVRRLEGESLHPLQDEAGVYRFDAAQVDRLATRQRLRGHWRSNSPQHDTLSAEDNDPHRRLGWSCGSVSSRLVAAQVHADLRPTALPPHATAVNALQVRVSELEARLSDRECSATEAEKDTKDECAAMAEDMLDVLASLSDRELRRLIPQSIDEIVACLDMLADRKSVV